MRSGAVTRTCGRPVPALAGRYVGVAPAVPAAPCAPGDVPSGTTTAGVCGEVCATPRSAPGALPAGPATWGTVVPQPASSTTAAAVSHHPRGRVMGAVWRPA